MKGGISIMAKNCKAIREFLFDELKAAMGQPQGEAERVLMADVCQLEKIRPVAVVSEYRRIHLRNAYRICKENVSEKQGFWGDIGCLLRENGIETSTTLEKAASDSVTGTELYKRIKKCMDEYVIPFQSVEVEAFFYGFFF